MATVKNGIAALAELARQVREHTLQFLPLPQQWLTWSPPGTSNHILWHAGHALWVQDALTVEPLTGRSELPPGWAPTFGENSRPSTIKDWPDHSEVSGHLEAQLARILDLIEVHAETIINRPDQTPARGGWPLLAGMIHGWHDEARHQGEMYLLFKLLRARSHSGGFV
ncbi:MAG: DinB family protein [Pirellulales bacterium]